MLNASEEVKAETMEQTKEILVVVLPSAHLRIQWIKSGGEIEHEQIMERPKTDKDAGVEPTQRRPLPKPSLEFLEELRERARLAGWDYDYIEVSSFVEGLYLQAGLPKPDMEPHE